MEQVIPGEDPGDPMTDQIIESNDRKAVGDYAGAYDILMKLCRANLRGLDAPSHLGLFSFEARPNDAIRHYEAGVRIGELSLPPGFDGVLPWGLIDNRPFSSLHAWVRLVPLALAAIRRMCRGIRSHALAEPVRQSRSAVHDRSGPVPNALGGLQRMQISQPSGYSSISWDNLTGFTSGLTPGSAEHHGAHERLLELAVEMDSDFEPYGKRDRDGPDCSCGCRTSQSLTGRFATIGASA